MSESESSRADAPLPIVPFLKTEKDGTPYLEQTVCDQCGAIYFRTPLACAKCFSRGSFSTRHAPETGELRAYSIVHRSIPGIDVPFVSAIVDFDGGGVLKGNLQGGDPDPAKIELGGKVRTRFQIAPRKDAAGHEYLMYAFEACQVGENQ